LKGTGSSDCSALSRASQLARGKNLFFRLDHDLLKSNAGGLDKFTYLPGTT